MFFLNLLFHKGKGLLCLILCIASTAGALPAYADREVTGTVTDESGSRLPGVSILIKGTQRGTTTSNEGTYSISVPDGATLVFSFVGFVSQEIHVGNRTNIDVTLVADNKALEELVVIGYGTARKSDLTGAVGSVREEQLRERPAPSLNQTLQGKISGVQVNENSGRPDGSARP